MGTVGDHIEARIFGHHPRFTLPRRGRSAPAIPPRSRPRGRLSPRAHLRRRSAASPGPAPPDRRPTGIPPPDRSPERRPRARRWRDRYAPGPSRPSHRRSRDGRVGGVAAALREAEDVVPGFDEPVERAPVVRDRRQLEPVFSPLPDTASDGKGRPPGLAVDRQAIGPRGRRALMRGDFERGDQLRAARRQDAGTERSEHAVGDVKRVEVGDAERRRAVAPVGGGRPSGHGRDRQQIADQRGLRRGGMPVIATICGRFMDFAGGGGTPARPGSRSRSTRGSHPDHPTADRRSLPRDTGRITCRMPGRVRSRRRMFRRSCRRCHRFPRIPRR